MTEGRLPSQVWASTSDAEGFQLVPMSQVVTRGAWTAVRRASWEEEYYDEQDKTNLAYPRKEKIEGAFIRRDRRRRWVYFQPDSCLIR